MNQSTCPIDQLPMLLADQLNPSDLSQVMEHLNGCESCQSKLNLLTADESWWGRAQRNLADADTDNEDRLLEPETVHCSIETLLEGELPTRDVITSNSVLSLLDPPSHPEMLGRIDEFEIEERIGQGGMGIVFRGFDRSLNRPVAIKVMAPHLGSNDVARQRFEREAKAAAAVVHPSVVPIYRVCTAQKHRPYIAMALADGLSLQEHVNRHGPMDVNDIVRVGIQIASGLAEAHKQGLIHRDIKPSNVLFEKDVSRIFITDFGLARAADDVMMTQSGCLAGTPSYMSPEQVTGKTLDARSDLFSLGSLLYFIATGREAFQADGAFAVINQVALHHPKSTRSINIDIPDVLNRIIERLLEKEPQNRIESAEKLEQLLTRVLAHLQEPEQNDLPNVKATALERRRNLRRIGVTMTIFSLIVCACLMSNGILEPVPSNPQSNHKLANHDQNSNDQAGEGSGREDSDPVSEQYGALPEQGGFEHRSTTQDAEGDQDADGVQDDKAVDPVLERILEKTREGLKASCRNQSNLRLNELQRKYNVPDSDVRKSRVLIKGVVEKTVRRAEERVSYHLNQYCNDGTEKFDTFSVNGEVYWVNPDEHQEAMKPKVAELQVFVDLPHNSMVVLYQGGRSSSTLGQRTNRVERMEFWELAFQKIEGKKIEQFQEFERNRRHLATVLGVVAIFSQELDLDQGQEEKLHNLIQHKVEATDGTLRWINEQFVSNDRLFEQQPDFLSETQLASWKLLSTIDRSSYLNVGNE